MSRTPHPSNPPSSQGPPVGAAPLRRVARARTRERGQGLVEFALILPVFLLLLVGAAEFGRAWMTQNVLTGAAREAVRIAAVQDNNAGAMSRAGAILSSAGITGASVTLSDDGVPYGTCQATVSYAFPLAVADFLPGLSCTTVPLTSTTSMRKEY